MRKFLLALVALVGLSTAAALGNYAMTQGAGTTFGSTIVGGVHYVQMFLCDLTTPGQCAAVSAGGAVKVDGSGATQPVSGTVAVTQSTSPWIVAGGGTAGSAASGVVTVQGIASMTPLFMQSATVPVSTMNSASANSGLNAAMAGVFDDTTPTSITENSFGFLRMSANRNLYGTIRDAAGNERGANVNASNQLAIAGPVTAVSGAYASGAFASGSMVDLLTVIGTKNNGTAATNALLAAGVYNSTPLTLTNTQQASHQLDANGYLKVNVAAGGAGGGAVTMASGAVASGAYSAGSYAAGALAAGAFATGSGVDGWDITQGAKADSVCGSATGTCSVIALLKYLNNAAGLPIPLNVNTVSTAQTGLTPGSSSSSQTGTIVAANVDVSSVAGVAVGVPAVFGSSPGAVRVQGVNAAVVPINSASTQNTTAASNIVLKSGAGGLINVTVTIGATSGWLMLFEATSAPSDGTVTPKFCRYVKSDGTGGSTSVSWTNFPMTFATGITAVFSSTGCFTKTASATAFFSGQVQ